MVSSAKSISHKQIQRQHIENPIIKGDFEHQQSTKTKVMFRFNSFLGSMLVVSIIVSMVSYSMVAAKETQVSVIHDDTTEINFENIELQNKVDHARSFYNINDKIAHVNFLTKPDKIMEVKADANAPSVNAKNEEVKVQPVSGY